MNESLAEQPLVSIVLPTYRRAHVLPHAIRSVLDQTYTNLELIVVDDNSPDDTQEVVRSFSDPRIRYVRNEPNLKLPRALNRGFSLAKGAFLTWTSDDNMYAPTAIEKMVETLTSRHGEFVYADYFLFTDVDESGRPLDAEHDRLPSQEQLRKGNHIGACFLYARKVYEEIGEYDPELFLVEDYDYFIRVSKRFKLNHLAEPLYFFRRDDATLYCSRFCEVKASDVLVRYKNDLLGEQELLEAMIGLILRDMRGLKNPLLRCSYTIVERISFRLTSLHRRVTAEYLRRQLGSRVKAVLDGYRSRNGGFRETRDALVGLMQRYGVVEYSPPVRKPDGHARTGSVDHGV